VDALRRCKENVWSSQRQNSRSLSKEMTSFTHSHTHPHIFIPFSPLSHPHNIVNWAFSSSSSLSYIHIYLIIYIWLIYYRFLFWWRWWMWGVSMWCVCVCVCVCGEFSPYPQYQSSFIINKWRDKRYKANNWRQVVSRRESRKEEMERSRARARARTWQVPKKTNVYVSWNEVEASAMILYSNPFELVFVYKDWELGHQTVPEFSLCNQPSFNPIVAPQNRREEREREKVSSLKR
jgi:hypothetical protein